jgi:lysophospholipase L1-like esterase
MNSRFFSNCRLLVFFSLALFSAPLFAQNEKPAAPAQNQELPAVAQWPADDQFPGQGILNKSDWFKKLWSARRTDFWQHRQSDKGAVVFLGDSITQGWSTLAKDFPKFKVANRGIGGDVSRGVWYRLTEDVLDLEPSAVVLLIGTNDIGLGGEPEDVARNVKGILAAIKKRFPKIPVIVCKVMPSSEAMKRPADKIKKLNGLVDEAIKGNPHFIRCDTWSIFADDKGDAKKDEFPDLLHPNAVGYAKWKAALEPFLAKVKAPPAGK